MSININCVSDKPEFINYFSENIILPERSEMTLVKANMDIPFVKLVAVTVPEIEAADRGNTCFVVAIDGIQENISWTDLFNAHVSLSNYDTDHGITAADYFSGQHEYLPNYPCVYTIKDLGPPIDYIYRRKLNFMEVVAEAISLKYDFYYVKNEPEYLGVDSSLVFPTRTVGVPLPDGTTSFADRIVNGLQTSNKLVATYSPQSMVNSTLAPVNISAASSINWTVGAASLTSGVAVSQAWFNDESGIDLNGGWYEFRADLTGGATASLMATGFTFNGVGEGAAGDEFQPTAVYQPEVIDVGIQFEKDAAGNMLYKIIDGQEQYVYEDATPLEVVTTKPIFKPSTAKHLFQGADAFYLQIQRGNLYNGTNEFVVNIYQGVPGQGIANVNTRKIYTSTRTLNSPAIIPNIGFMCNANAGNAFSQIQYVARTTQTNQQVQWRDIDAGAQLLGQFSIMPVITELTTPANKEGTIVGRSLWSAYGFSTLGVPVPAGSAEVPGRDFTSIDSVNQTLTLSRKTNFTTHNSTVRYHLGVTALENLFQYNLGFGVILNQSAGLSDLPKEFKVAIRSLPVKSFNGSYLLQSTAAAEERVIGTVPLPNIDEDLDVSIPIIYEPYNLLYRPLNNVNPFATNKLDIEIFFHDFQTNIRKSFTSVNGHLTLEINARQGAKDPAMKNNLRPI